MKKSIINLRVVLVVMGLLIVCFSFYVWQIFFTPNFLINKKPNDPPSQLVIPTGGTIEDVRASLKKLGIMGDMQSFYFLTRLLNYNENVKPGRYLIYPRMGNYQLIQKLKKGLQDPVKVTFTNIRLKHELSTELSEYIEPRASTLDSLMKDKEFVAQYGFDTTTIMTMFIPNTYQMYWNISPKKLFDKMYQEYKKFWNADRLQKANNLGLTPIQVSILASIVQAETQQSSEKSRIAGVYLNRLKKQMLLQADPTLVYAVGDFTIRRVLNVHKEMVSPYNTYMFPGLPPGPINLPSSNTIDAVLNAEKHDYLFFCASPNSPGFHDFAVSLNDHLKNAKGYQAHLNKRKIF
jgi:UPF0755 protein